jgi:hypothetical protein
MAGGNKASGGYNAVALNPALPLVPATANTLGPKILFSADYAIGGCDGGFKPGYAAAGPLVLDAPALR